MATLTITLLVRNGNGCYKNSSQHIHRTSSAIVSFVPGYTSVLRSRWKTNTHWEINHSLWFLWVGEWMNKMFSAFPNELQLLQCTQIYRRTECESHRTDVNAYKSNATKRCVRRLTSRSNWLTWEKTNVGAIGRKGETLLSYWIIEKSPFFRVIFQISDSVPGHERSV